MREFVFNETMQVGIVVRDLDAAIRCDLPSNASPGWRRVCGRPCATARHSGGPSHDGFHTLGEWLGV
jgi:hypothetical protein